MAQARQTASGAGWRKIKTCKRQRFWECCFSRFILLASANAEQGQYINISVGKDPRTWEILMNAATSEETFVHSSLRAQFWKWPAANHKKCTYLLKNVSSFFSSSAWLNPCNKIEFLWKNNIWWAFLIYILFLFNTELVTYTNTFTETKKLIKESYWSGIKQLSPSTLSCSCIISNYEFEHSFHISHSMFGMILLCHISSYCTYKQSLFMLIFIYYWKIQLDTVYTPLIWPFKNLPIIHNLTWSS